MKLIGKITSTKNVRMSIYYDMDNDIVICDGEILIDEIETLEGAYNAITDMYYNKVWKLKLY